MRVARLHLPRRSSSIGDAIRETKWSLVNSNFFLNQLNDLNERSSGPFALEFFWSSELTGFLPWSCVDIPEGRIVAFAGVRDEQLKSHLRWERGTDEYYGRGERERRPGFIAYFISNKSGPETGPMPNIRVVVQPRYRHHRMD